MSGNLYQLSYSTSLKAGAPIVIDGPYDYYGTIIKKLKPDPIRPGFSYFLIRGKGGRHARN